VTVLTRRKFLQGIAAAGVAVGGGVGAYGYVYGRRQLTLTSATIPVADLPQSLDGLRIALLTDIHRSSWVSHEDVEAAVRLVMDQRPDLIVLGGDYITRADRRYMEPCAEALKSLSARFGVFGILGNHDDDRDMPAALESRGVEVLKDARTRVSIRDEPVDLVGIRYWTRHPAEIGQIMRGATGTVILLAHDPRRLVEAERLNIPLVLSWHTHGGQVVLPAIGAIAAYKFPVVAGLGRQARTTVFVSRGLGTVYVPVRVNCPPEVALLTLSAA